MLVEGIRSHWKDDRFLVISFGGLLLCPESFDTVIGDHAQTFTRLHLRVTLVGGAFIWFGRMGEANVVDEIRMKM